jgi:hypothetical protein
MGANIASWTKAYLGYSMTPQQFLNSPSAQEKVAKGKLKSYYNKYGAKGAASAWYSGNPNLYNSTSSQPGGPSIKGYVDSVIAKAYKYPSGGGKSSGGGSKGVTPEAKKLDKNEQAEQYGFVLEMFDSIPELKKKFQQAIDGDWSVAKFQAELRDTKWWKSNPESAKKFLTLQYGDPATAKQQLSQMQVKVAQMTKAIGGDASGKKMKALALKAIMNGWDDGMLRYQIGRVLPLKGDIRPGEAGEAIDKLSEYAYGMGVTMSDQWYDLAARKIVSGMGTSQDYEDKIRKSAATMFPQWKKQIDAGQSVADIASPYFQSMAQILELPDGSVNLFDKTIKKALQYKDPQTGSNSVKPIWQFENDLRSDERWKGTQNAQNSMMQVAHQVLADFGLKY